MFVIQLYNVKKHQTYFLLPLIILLCAMAVVLPQKSSGQLVGDKPTDMLYKDLGLEGKLDYDIFRSAIEGMKEYEFERAGLLTIIDYTKASHKERIFVIDLEKEKLLFNTLFLTS